MSTIHASVVLVGARAVLIRGPAGAGKSRLALALIEAGAAGRLPFARLVSDDRTIVEAVNGRLLVRAPEAIAGLIELRGIGICRIPHEAAAVVGWVVDLDVEAAERLPEHPRSTTVNGIELPLLAVPRGTAPLPMLLAVIRPVE